MNAKTAFLPPMQWWIQHQPTTDHTGAILQASPIQPNQDIPRPTQMNLVEVRLACLAEPRPSKAGPTSWTNVAEPRRTGMKVDKARFAWPNQAEPFVKDRLKCSERVLSSESLISAR